MYNKALEMRIGNYSSKGLQNSRKESTHQNYRYLDILV